MLAGLSVLVGGLAWYLVAPSLYTRGEHVTSLPLPFKPSIAVLPFVNMSSDPEQEYFSDGMTDTLITDLSKLGGLFVIARNSTFVYKAILRTDFERKGLTKTATNCLNVSVQLPL